MFVTIHIGWFLAIGILYALVISIAVMLESNHHGGASMDFSEFMALFSMGAMTFVLVAGLALVTVDKLVPDLVEAKCPAPQQYTLKVNADGSVVARPIVEKP